MKVIYITSIFYWDIMCSKCFGPLSSQCSSCSGSNVLDGTTWKSSCPQGKFAYNGICQACHNYCSEWTGPGNSNWNVCNPGYLLQGTTWDTTCGIGYFPYNYKCFSWASNWAVWSGEFTSEWTSCMTGYAFQGNDWLSIQYLSSQCLSNQYFKEVECVDWDKSCKSCTGDTNKNWIECNKGYTLVGGYWVSFKLIHKSVKIN